MANKKNKWLMEAIDKKKLYGGFGKRKKGIGKETLAGYLRKQKALGKDQSSVITPTPSAEKGMRVLKTANTIKVPRGINVNKVNPKTGVHTDLQKWADKDPEAFDNWADLHNWRKTPRKKK